MLRLTVRRHLRVGGLGVCSFDVGFGAMLMVFALQFVLYVG